MADAGTVTDELMGELRSAYQAGRYSVRFDDDTIPVGGQVAAEHDAGLLAVTTLSVSRAVEAERNRLTNLVKHRLGGLPTNMGVTELCAALQARHERELAELREDKARLDWLQSRGAIHVSCPQQEGGTFIVHRGSDRSANTDLRAALDAAKGAR